MAKNPRPTDQMLAASLLEGRKVKKDPHVTQIRKAAPVKAEESKRSAGGIGFFKSLTQRDKASQASEDQIEFAPQPEIDSPGDSAGPSNDFQDFSDFSSQPETLSKHLETPNKNVEKIKAIRAKTLWETDSGDRPEQVHSTPKDPLPASPKMQSKTQWDIDDEDDPVQASRPPQHFVIEEADPTPVSASPAVSWSEPAQSEPFSESGMPSESSGPYESFSPPESFVPSEISSSSTQSFEEPVASSTLEAPVAVPLKKTVSLKLSGAQKLYLSLGSLALPLVFMLLALVMGGQMFYVLGALVTLLVSAGLVGWVVLPLARPQAAVLPEDNSLSDAEALEMVSMARLETEKYQKELEQYQPIKENLNVLEGLIAGIAEGDLSRRASGMSEVLIPSENAVNALIEDLREVLTEVRQASQVVAEGAGQMHQITDVISKRTPAQVQETKAGYEQLQGLMQYVRSTAQHIDGSSKSAEQTRALSSMGQQALQEALQGVQALQEDVGTVSSQVKKLNQHSQDIGLVSETLSDIASQTSLLALGAALEAAGAGEAGRRFAVVAEEVGRLAERSATSAREVYALIQSIQQEVHLVMGLVDQSSGHAANTYKIAVQVDQHFEDISQIARRSLEVSQGLRQNAQQHFEQIKRVGQVLQGNAGFAQTSHNSFVQGRDVAQNLKQTAEHLEKQLRRYKLS